MENDIEYLCKYDRSKLDIKFLRNAFHDYFWRKHTMKKNRKKHICKRMLFKIKK